MNRTVSQAAALLNIPARELRAKLRAWKITNLHRELISSQRQKGRFFTDVRSRWNPNINKYTHYGVVMITEEGMTWLAKQLNVSVTITKDKDVA